MNNSRKFEYGGYLPIETHFSNESQHYFKKQGQNVQYLNCGRTCFYVAAKSASIKKYIFLTLPVLKLLAL